MLQRYAKHEASCFRDTFISLWDYAKVIRPMSSSAALVALVDENPGGLKRVGRHA
jgi:hypothetical protein